MFLRLSAPIAPSASQRRAWGREARLGGARAVTLFDASRILHPLRSGDKHVLGIETGATENAAAVKKLLVGLRDRGLRTDQRYLFVIDGAKALRAGIEEVFGADQAVQRCRNHIAR